MNNSGPPMFQHPIMAAGIKLLEGTGMRQFQLRYSDDEQPVVWMAVAKWSLGGQGVPVAKGGKPAFDTASALDPVSAVLRLCDQMLNGGYCLHCERPSGVTLRWDAAMPLADMICWYVYDPELQVFRRSCEND